MSIDGIGLFLSNRPGWRSDETSFYYDLSFNDTFPARFSRDDLGLEPLYGWNSNPLHARAAPTSRHAEW